MATKAHNQGTPKENDSENQTIKHETAVSWDACYGQRSIQMNEATESEAESTEACEDGDVDEDLGRRVKAIIEGFDKPYDPLREPTPNLPAYHPSFGKVEHIYAEVVEDAINLLRLSPYKDIQTEALVEHMESRREVTYSKAKIVGMIGDSGVGKSSLINSLLDTPELANEGANGSACTCVVTEYQHAWPSQKSPFAAEIVFFETSVIETIIKDHFREYYRYYCEPPDELEPAAQEEGLHLATTALEAFRALLCTHKEFETDESATEFLSSAESADDPVILNRIVSWTKQLMAKELVVDGIGARNADTPEELSGLLERFIKPVSVSEGERPIASLWPIVRIVRVGLQSKLLAMGLVVADLPGLSDINKTRTRVTERYIRKCSYIFLVAPIGRVTTDNLVQRRLVEGFYKHGARKILVCTYSDIMPGNSKPKDLSASTEDTEDHKSIVDDLKATFKEIEALKISMRKLKGSARKETAKQLKKLALRTKALSALGLEALINMRNAKIRSVMRKRYSQITPDVKPLHVICVSNQHYRHHLEGYDADSIPISIQSTGIPELRSLLLTLPAGSKLNVLSQYRYGILPDIISSIEMWASKSATKRRSELRLIAAKPREAVEGHIVQFLEKVKANVAKVILTVIMAPSNDWGVVPPRGKLCHQEQEHSSWNTELLEPVSKDLVKAWEAFDYSLKNENENCLSALADSIDSIREDLKDTPGVEATDMTPFLASLNSKKVLLENRVRETFKDLQGISRDAKLEAVFDGADSYVMQAMVPLYDRLGALSDPKSCIRRKAVFQDAIGRGEPFSKFLSGITEAFDSALTEHQANVISQVQEIFDLILKDFDNMFVDKEVDDPMMHELRQQVKDFVLKANKRIHGEMDREMAIAMGSDPRSFGGLEA